MVGARLITRLFDLATMLVLARILQPRDFGIVAVAMTLVTLVESATEMPINQALVRLESLTQAHLDTAFTVSALRGLVLTCILLLLALPFAHFYHDTRLTPLVCVVSLAPSARAFFSPKLAAYQKNMSFWRDFVIELSGKMAGFFVGITTALLTHSYWSIASATIALPIATTAVSYVLAPYRPRLSLAEAPIFSSFIGWMSAAQILSAVNWQFERLLLGRLVRPSQLGLFTTSSDIATLPFLAFFGPIIRPLLAAFSHLRNSPVRLGESYQMASYGVMALGLPALVGESLIAEPLVRLLLGTKWLGAALLVQCLALSTIPALLAMPAIPLIMAIGNTRLIFTRNLIDVCVKFPIALFGTLAFGFAGIIAARFVSEVAAGLYCMIVVRQLAGVSVKDQFLAQSRIIVSVAAMAGAIALQSRFLSTAEGSSKELLDVAIPVLLGIGTYCTALLALWRIVGKPPGVEAKAVKIVSKKCEKLMATAAAAFGQVACQQSPVETRLPEQ